MRLGPVDFNDKILTSLLEGKLVVFAGAGVSINDPANLPTFEGLASEVASRTDCPIRKGEGAVDYFSRIDVGDVDVHREVADLLMERNPEPNSLHQNIVRLFAGQTHPKIVTTNFDLLFEAADSSGGTPNYTAPALPPGDRFQGIVHLHGDISQPEEMVITLADVSRAYLVEGWALNFLKQMFSEFTVLFVGYSHDDIMMQYLARGMPAQSEEDQRRFALIPENERQEARWREWGITPVTFPEGPKGRYENLPPATDKLVEFITRGPSEWRQRIQEIASSPVAPSDPEDQDIIAEALRDADEKLQFFTESAQHPYWLEWLERNSSIKRLFTPTGLNPVELKLAEWMGNTYTVHYPEELRALIDRQDSYLNPVLWEQMACALANQAGGAPIPVATRPWVSLLLNKTPHPSVEQTCNGLDRIAEVCLRDNLTTSLATCFGEMCRTEMKVRGNSVELATACPHWMLQKAWLMMKSFLSHMARPMIDQATGLLEERHTMFLEHDPSGDAEKSDSLRRQKILHPPDEASAIGPDAIVDAARDCLQWLAGNEPERTRQWCDRHIKSEAALLTRLATFTIGYIPALNLSDDDKIHWIVDNQLIYHRYAAEEAKEVAELALPGASETARDRLYSTLTPQAEPVQEPR